MSDQLASLADSIRRIEIRLQNLDHEIARTQRQSIELSASMMRQIESVSRVTMAYNLRTLAIVATVATITQTQQDAIDTLFAAPNLEEYDSD